MRTALLARSTALLASIALVVAGVECAPSAPTVPAPNASLPSGRSSSSVTGPVSRQPGDLHPLGQKQFDVGRVDASTRLEGMSILFQPSAAQKARAAAVLRDLQDPSSPSYHQWLTPAKYAAWFGPSRGEIATATAWLASQGFTVHGSSNTGMQLFFSGNVGQLETSFHTEMHHYQVRGKRHFALAVQPTYPAELSAALGLRGVHDFQWKPTFHHPKPTPDTIIPYPEDGGAFEFLGLSPADWATIYDVQALYDANITGTNQKIAIVGESEFNDADIKAFRNDFNLDVDPSNPRLPTRDFVTYSGSPAFESDPFGEAELDLEWSGGVAKNASIFYCYTGDNPAYGAFDAVIYAIDKGTYPIISASFCGCEYENTPSDAIFFATMGDAASMEGVTLVNASGDWGSATCDAGNDFSETAAVYGPSVGFPTDIPSVVSVGGTELDWGDKIPQPGVTAIVASGTPFSTYWDCTTTGTLQCAAKSYVPEEGWNEVTIELESDDYFWGAGGGGMSTIFAKPYWQVGQTLPGSMRQVPDVALSAAYAQVGYAMSSSWTADDGDAMAPMPQTLYATGGTSAATPSFAGVLALLNDAIAQKHPGTPVGLGNANPILYAINASTKGAAQPAFHDITTGNNIMPCQKGTMGCPATAPYAYGYQAGPGYDMVTGIGSIDAFQLVTAWSELSPTSTTFTVTPSSGTVDGSPVTLTATVTSNAESPSMTGSVLFYLVTQTDAGLADLALSATATLTAGTDGGVETGGAQATAIVPAGLLGGANIAAFYAGDSHYLASWSAKQTVAATSPFAVAPTTIGLGPNEQYTFTTTGGAPPVVWTIVSDTTCDANYVCAQIEQLTATSGAYQAGDADGTTVIEAIDANGAERRITVLVTGATVDGGVFPPPFDAGSDASSDNDASLETSDAEAEMDAAAVVDATVTADATAPTQPTVDAALPSDSGSDASGSSGGGSSSGCSCVAAGGDGERSPGGALAGVLLAVGLAARRRRR